jgi:hypothetical protein
VFAPNGQIVALVMFMIAKWLNREECTTNWRSNMSLQEGKELLILLFVEVGILF